jgi:hypothetical protein
MLLTEGMKTVNDLPLGARVEIKGNRNGKKMGIFLIFPYKEDEFRRVGILVMKTPDPSQCLSAFEIERTNTRQAPGFGPLLYDIAMELAGKNGIMADRFLVSDYSEKVWQFYFENRADVRAVQLDRDYPAQFTEPEDDDCSQGAFDYIYQKSFFGPTPSLQDVNTDTEEYKNMFFNHPLTKKYIKIGGTPILDELQQKNLVRYI